MQSLLGLQQDELRVAIALNQRSAVKAAQEGAPGRDAAKSAIAVKLEQSACNESLSSPVAREDILEASKAKMATCNHHECRVTLEQMVCKRGLSDASDMGQLKDALCPCTGFSITRTKDWLRLNEENVYTLLILAIAERLGQNRLP